MTAAGLIVTALVVVLLVMRELARIGVAGPATVPARRLDELLPPLLFIWFVLTAVRVASYL